MAKRFVKTKNYTSWSGKSAEEKAAYQDSIIFVDDRKLIIEGNADNNGFTEFDGRTVVGGEVITVAELQSASGPYVGQVEVSHGSPLTGTAITPTNGGSVTSGSVDVITSVSKDKFGHVTGATKKSITLPTNTNTTYDLTTTSSTSNGKLNLVAGGSGSGTDTITITGSGTVSVKSDASGNITITGADQYKGDITGVTAGTGLTGGGTSGAVTVSANLKSTAAHTASSATPTNTASRQYAVGVDKDGYLSVNVPWSDTDNDTKVTSAANHYAPAADSSAELTATTSGTATVADGGSVITGFKLQRDAKGHVVGATATTGKIDYPTVPSVGEGTLTIKVNGTSKGTFSANASSNKTIDLTASDLGLTGAIKFVGLVPKLPTSFTNYKLGDVVLLESSNKEFLLTSKESDTVGTWTELGDEGSHALKSVKVEGTGVLSGGGTLEANRTITHNKVLGTAITTAKGGVSGNTITVPTITADEYGHLKAVGTQTWTYTAPTIPTLKNVFGVVKVGSTNIEADTTRDTLELAAGTGITLTPDATNDKITIAAVNNGTVTSVTAGTGLTGGTITTSGTINLATSGVTAGSYGDDEASRTLTHGDDFDVPQITVDAYGRITAASSKKLVLPASGDTDKKTSSTADTSTAKLFVIGAASQSSNGQATKSNVNVYIDASKGALYANSIYTQVNGAVINTDDWAWEVLS